jgi:hypothetical protein
MLINRMFLIIILLYLFSPIYFVPVVILILLVFSIITSKKIALLQRSLFYPILVLVLLSLLMIILNLQTGKEIVELYKWTTISLLILFFQKQRSETFLIAFQVYSILSFIMLLIQQFYPDNHLVIQIANYYASYELIEENFVKGNVRSIGFNEGPGHVGVLISFNLLIIFLKYKWGIISRVHRYLAIIFSVISIVVTAGKGTLPIFFILNKRISFIMFGLISIIFLSIFSIDDLFYLERLTNSASGEARVDMWSTFINKTMSDPLIFLFGNARVNELVTISIFDSDWIYIFFTKGILGVSLLLVILLQLSLRLQWSKSSVFFLLLVFILIGFANPAFTDIKFGIIYFYLLISLSYIREKRKNQILNSIIIQ